MDTYQSLTKTIRTSPEYFFERLLTLVDNFQLPPKLSQSNFQKIWNDRNDQTRKHHHQFLRKVKFSDFKAYEIILKNIPPGSNFQMGNSAGVRYIQLFEQRKDLSYNSNRGTSGIDGSTSTAVGAAVASGKPTTLVCGDLSFFYDVNGLWNPYLPANLRIIIINNSGGGIFRIIPGPSTSDELDEFFEVTQKRTAEPIAKMYNLDYQKANSVKSLEKELPKFYKKGKRAKILEVFTPRKSNDKILESYFEFLKK